MKIDFHTHGKLAKKLPFSKEYTDWLFREALNSGLDAICLTEHFNTNEFEEVYQYISQNATRVGDSFLINGLQIFSGMEIDISENGHILTIGSREDILKLNKELKPYREKDNYLSMTKLLERTRDYNFIVGAAHPFRDGSKIPGLGETLLTRLDFVDLNGKDMAYSPDIIKISTKEFGDRYDLAVLAGSDTHQSLQYGCIYNIFEKDCNTIDQLKDSIQKKEYEIKLSSTVKSQVYYAGLLKRSLKEIHELGGDYVGVLTGHEDDR